MTVSWLHGIARCGAADATMNAQRYALTMGDDQNGATNRFRLNGVGIRRTLYEDLWHSCALWEQAGPRRRTARCALRLLTTPRIRAVVLVRLAQLAFHQAWSAPISYLLMNRVLRTTGAEIHPGSQIGPGLNLVHTAGIVIGRHARIGRDLSIFQGVTVGDNGTSVGQPVIGDGVRLGAGAKVLGPIRVGNSAVVGANAVLVSDVADCDVVAGIPARSIMARE